MLDHLGFWPLGVGSSFRLLIFVQSNMEIGAPLILHVYTIHKDKLGQMLFVGKRARASYSPVAF